MSISISYVISNINDKLRMLNDLRECYNYFSDSGVSAIDGVMEFTEVRELTEFLSEYVKNLKINGWGFIALEDNSLHFGKTVNDKLISQYEAGFEKLGFVINSAAVLDKEEQYSSVKDGIEFIVCTHSELNESDLLLSISLELENVQQYFIHYPK